MGQFRDLTGQTFGRLTARERVENNKLGQVCWKCDCTCGNTPTVSSGALLSGDTRSCGCLKREQTAQRSRQGNATHGHARVGKVTKEFRTWMGAISRCDNPKNGKFHSHGARGITMCEGLRDFPFFLKHMGYAPSPKHSIDRKDNDGHYSCGQCPQCLANGWPNNVRWATKKEQANNKRNNHPITFNNETLNVAQWEEVLGFNPGTVKARLYLGWSEERALTTPVHYQKRALPVYS